MGGLGGVLGLSGGAGGSGFSGPQGTQINQGTVPGQIDTSYNGVQNSLQSQQALLAALQAQNGIGNQSQVYGQLQGVVNGSGPNPAQAMLANATGANVANQAALMAGQRGAGANVGLMARQAAQQGGALQQNAAGQAAALQAQQSLGALGQAGALANQQVGQQMGATTANTQAQQSEQQLLQNALANANNSNVAMQGNVNNVNAGLAGQTMGANQGLIGGAFGALGVGANAAASKGAPAGAAAAGAEGGMVQKMAGGGFLTGWPSENSGTIGAPQIAAPTFSPNTAANTAMQNGGSSLMAGIKGKSSGSPSENGFAPGVSDTGEGYSAMARGGNVGSKLKSGGHVPGKPKVAGNSLKNDNVKAILSPGELVVDRETMADGGPAGQAARFLAAAIAAKKKGKK